MLSVLEINKIIAEKLRFILKGSDYENIEILSSDISEGFNRPSLKIELNDMNYSTLNSNFIENNLEIRIYFFAKDLKNYKIENFKAQSLIINELLNGINTEYGYIPINDIDSDIVDTVLIISFDLNILNQKRDIETEQAEYMESLEFEFEYEYTKED